MNSRQKPVCVHGYVSAAPLDGAGADAKIAPEVNGHRPFTRGRSVADAPAPSEEQALNTREHIQKLSSFCDIAYQGRKYSNAFSIMKNSKS